MSKYTLVQWTYHYQHQRLNQRYCMLHSGCLKSMWIIVFHQPHVVYIKLLHCVVRYCWRCHQAGHENWQCREDVQPGGWCPRCLETSHWEDQCWVSATSVTCPVCSLPGHLPCIHQASDFRQRKLVIDTFGWLPFKDWFQVCFWLQVL